MARLKKGGDEEDDGEEDGNDNGDEDVGKQKPAPSPNTATLPILS